MQLDKIYDRLRTEIENESSLPNSTKFLLRSMLIECFMDFLVTDQQEFNKQTKEFNTRLYDNVCELNLSI